MVLEQWDSKKLAQIKYTVGVRRGLVEIKNQSRRHTCHFCGKKKLSEVYVGGKRFLMDNLTETLHRCPAQADRSWEPVWVKNMRRQIKRIKKRRFNHGL
jgi:hypothetical protein